MSGDGMLETYCAKCGFGVRQTAVRKKADVSTLPVAAREALFDPLSADAGFQTPSKAPARPLKKGWAVAWAVALYAIYDCLIGKDWYLPIYFAGAYLWLFSLALYLHRVERANRYTEELTSMNQGALVLVGWIAGFWASWNAPSIGEANYCAARASSWRVPPTVFRCTEIPLDFIVFVATIWILGWLMIWYNRSVE
jgi:hypothetical protein